MVQSAESSPTKETPELLLVAVVRYEQRIQAASDDIIEQASLYFEQGQLYARAGRYEEAIDDFAAARERYLIEHIGTPTPDANDEIISLINSQLEECLKALGHHTN